MLSDEGVIFYHMPPDVAKSFQVAVIFFSLFFGMTVLDLVSHIAFDLRLLRKSGWSTPVKAGSRLAYLTCRYMSFIALLLVIVYLVAPQANCEALPRTFNILGMFILDCVTLIFVQRVMALHGYERAVVLPLAAGFAIVVALSIVSIPFYGTGERLPGSVYCYYNPHRNEERTRAVNITYKVSATYAAHISSCALMSASFAGVSGLCDDPRLCDHALDPSSPRHWRYPRTSPPRRPQGRKHALLTAHQTRVPLLRDADGHRRPLPRSLLDL